MRGINAKKRAQLHIASRNARDETRVVRAPARTDARALITLVLRILEHGKVCSQARGLEAHVKVRDTIYEIYDFGCSRQLSFSVKTKKSCPFWPIQV